MTKDHKTLKTEPEDDMDQINEWEFFVEELIKELEDCG